MDSYITDLLSELGRVNIWITPQYEDEDDCQSCHYVIEDGLVYLEGDMSYPYDRPVGSLEDMDNGWWDDQIVEDTEGGIVSYREGGEKYWGSYLINTLMLYILDNDVANKSQLDDWISDRVVCNWLIVDDDEQWMVESVEPYDLSDHC